MSSQSTQALPLDLAARSIDLVSVLGNTGSGYGSIAKELIQWLARERISEDALTFALTLVQSFANPNEVGATILRHLEEKVSRIGGLVLILPGALGRSIMFDKKLRWMATTEGVLLGNHNFEYISLVLIEILIFSHMKR